MKKSLVIFGTGKISKVLTEYFTSSNEFNIAAFTCDRKFVESTNFEEYPLIPFDEIEKKFSPSQFQMYVAIGYQNMNSIRANIFNGAKIKGYKMASYINPDSRSKKKITCGENCFIADGVSIQPGASIGNNVSIWSNSVIGHDSLIKDHTWISAGAVIGGNSSVGEKSFIGLNATIGNNVVVGDSCLIGARTLITKALYQESVVVDRDSEILRLTSKQFIKITKLK